MTNTNMSATEAFSQSFADSPVHWPGRTRRWTTANVDEGLPGTITPITWSMYFPPTESTMRDCWVDFGVLPTDQRAVPADIDRRFLSVAYGHAIANVDLMGQMAARIPGGTAAAMEQQLFGSADVDVEEPKGLEKVGRYPHVLAKMPPTVWRAIKGHRPLAAQTDAWWRREVFGNELEFDRAVAALVKARAHFEKVLGVHMVLSMAGQGLFGQVETLAGRSGHPGLGGEVVKTDKGTTEFELVRDLWRLSRAELPLQGFLRVHGYHGPREGLVDSVIWREDSTPIIELAAAYRSARGIEGMDTLAERRAREHRDAMVRFESGLGKVSGRIGRLLVRWAAHVPEWRETGRANILKSVDVARHAHRAVGLGLLERGLADDPAESRFLTIDELVGLQRGGLDPAALPELIARRRRDHDAFAVTELPHVWRGLPPTYRRAADVHDNQTVVTEVSGLGVSAGVAEGVVRMVLDLDAADFFDDEEPVVMVCKATDPSWASLFPLAAAVVTDVGSQMSHAAIVCRELGLPCVANTRTGTASLRDGMRVRVDGSAGLVTVLPPK